MSEEKQIVSVSPAELMTQALEKGLKPEQLEKMLDIQERWEATQARKAFRESMVEAQNKMPVVPKNLTNPQTHSKYAALDTIIQKAKPIYTEYGFSINFYEGETPKPEHMRIMADVGHKQGYKETHWYDVPLDGKGIKGNANMTAIHGKASSASYGQRYLMCLIWNIPTGDDNDGNNASIEYITEEQQNIIQDNLIAKNIKEERLLKVLKAESLSKIETKDFERALKLVREAK